MTTGAVDGVQKMLLSRTGAPRVLCPVRAVTRGAPISLQLNRLRRPFSGRSLGRSPGATLGGTEANSDRCLMRS